MHQLVSGEDVDDPAPLIVAGDEIIEVERRFAKKAIPSLRAQLQQRALDRADALLRHIAVSRGHFLGAICDVDEHRLQVIKIEQQQPFLVRDMECDGQHAFLHFVEVHQARQHQRPHFRNRGAYRMPAFAEQVPELHRIVGIDPFAIAYFLSAVGKNLVVLLCGCARHRHAG